MPPISDGLEKHKDRTGRGGVGEGGGGREGNAETALSPTHRGRGRGQWGRVREVDIER